VPKTLFNGAIPNLNFFGIWTYLRRDVDVFSIWAFLGPFLRSDTESDFPRLVRSAKRLGFAATVFARSKPVN